jgi:N-acetylmannosaminyltransferase (EC 2.4.1.187)
MRRRVVILGVAIDDVLMDEAIAAVARFIDDAVHTRS